MRSQEIFLIGSKRYSSILNINEWIIDVLITLANSTSFVSYFCIGPIFRVCWKWHPTFCCSGTPRACTGTRHACKSRRRYDILVLAVLYVLLPRLVLFLSAPLCFARLSVPRQRREHSLVRPRKYACENTRACVCVRTRVCVCFIFPLALKDLVLGLSFPWFFER